MEYKLAEPNKFGNWDRFTDEKGGQDYKTMVVLDHEDPDSVAVWYCGKVQENKHPHFDCFNKSLDWGELPYYLDCRLNSI